MRRVTDARPPSSGKNVSVTGMGARFDGAGTTSKEKRAKHSAWFLTISTNKGEKQCDTRMLAQEFHQVLKLMCQEKGLEEIVTFKPKGHALSTHLDRSHARLVVEVGSHPKGSRVHAHILLNIRHFSQVALDRTMINDFITSRIQTVALSNLYINWKMVGYSLNIEEYMNKYRPVY